MFADIVKIASGELGKDVDIYIYTPEKSMRFKSIFLHIQQYQKNFL